MQTEIYDWPALARWAEHAAASCVRKMGCGCESAQDLSQEALLRLHQMGTAAVVPRDPKAWLGTVLTRLAIDAARREARVRRGIDALESHPRMAGEPAGEGQPDPLACAIADEIHARLTRMLEGFPAPDRQIAVMEAVGFSRREISDWLMQWRPVGRHEVRRLIVRTHRRLRLQVQSADVQGAQQQSASRRKTVRWTTPPQVPKRLPVLASQ